MTTYTLVFCGDLLITTVPDGGDIEAAIKAEVDSALVTIHVEPEQKAKHAGIVVL